jgi:hypothetical protein
LISNIQPQYSTGRLTARELGRVLMSRFPRWMLALNSSLNSN